MTKTTSNKCLSFTKESLLSYLSIAFWFFIAACGLRIFEAALITASKGNFGLNCLNGFLGILNDILVFARYSVIMFPLFLLLCLLSKKLARWLLRLAFSALIPISIALILYYLSAGLPLDKVILVYPLHDIIDIARSSKDMAWWEYTIVFAFPISFLIISCKRIKLSNIIMYIFLGIAALSCIVRDVPSIFYKSHISYYTISNKLDYFINKLLESDGKPLNAENIDENALSLQSYFTGNDFVGTEYPFLHADKSPDVLSNFFEFTDKKPNIVLIIVEGLGRTVCGENSYYPSATKFLDSLASKSLYWENCFSSSHRTVNVLPTIFGSLPFGEKGFMFLKTSVPEFTSFPLIFKDNGYNLSFFYGGGIHFDDVSFFIKANKFDNYINEWLYKTHPERNSWGIYDHAMFDEAFKITDFYDNTPRLDVYLTLTTHEYYEYPNSEAYTAKYQDMVRAQNKHKIQNKNSFLAEASFLYFDECFRKLMDMYKEQPGYENTVFIITGDHNYDPPEEYWRSCHVPLIIWSPMLKTSKKFSAIVTHRDIAPSLVSLMKNKFNFKTPQNVTWINTGLDTVPYFRGKSFTPQFNVARSLSEMVYHDKFINNKDIYTFYNYDGVLSLSKSAFDKSLLNLFDIYKHVDKYVVNYDKLIESKYKAENFNIFNITDVSCADSTLEYCKERANFENMQDSVLHGKSHVLNFEKEPYPLVMFEYAIPNDRIKDIKVEYGFELFLKDNDGHQLDKNICVVYEVKNANDSLKYWTHINLIRTSVYDKYDDWGQFSFIIDFKKEKYTYVEGDRLRIYLWNRYLMDCCLSDFYFKADAWQEK